MTDDDEERGEDETNREEEEELLLALALRAEERAQPADPRHERTVLGDPDAAAELEREAAGSEESAALLEIHRPLTKDELRALTERLSSRLEPARPARRRFRPRWATRFRLLSSAAVSAVLAACFLLLASPPEGPPPIYALEKRSAEGAFGPHVLRAGGHVELIVRPERLEYCRVDIQAYVVRGDLPSELLEGRDVLENGAARIELAVIGSSPASAATSR